MFWPSRNIKLFYESKEKKINFLNLEDKKNNLMYVYENQKYKNILLKDLKKKKIKTINKKINNLEDLKNYDLIILCLGKDSRIYDMVVRKRSIKKDYKEIAITGHIKHNMHNLNTSQFFLKEGPLAILPFKKNQFSFVWSVNKNFYAINKNTIKILISKKIKELLKIKKQIKLSNFQFYPINLRLKRNYHNKNILILGEGLHTIHPVAGQGFNLVLRDIKKLKEILKYYSSLGISFKNSYALKDFYLKRKPENILFGLGIDATHNFFKESKYLAPLQEIILKNISNNNFIKKISKKISNTGLSI